MSCIEGKKMLCGQSTCDYHKQKSVEGYEGTMCCRSESIDECKDKGCNQRILKINCIQEKDTHNLYLIPLRSSKAPFEVKCSDCGFVWKPIISNFTGGISNCRKCSDKRNGSIRKTVLSREQFIQQSIQNPNNYTLEYDKIPINILLKLDDDVTLHCTIHGNFTQNVRQHYSYEHGCNDCGRERARIATMQRAWIRNVSPDSIIAELENTHEKKGYDFSETLCFLQTYRDTCEGNPIVSYTCLSHGKQTKLLYDLKTGHGCDMCAQEYRHEQRQYTWKDDWLPKLQMKHPNVVFPDDVEWTEEIRQQQKITAYCKECNAYFTSRISNILSGHNGEGSKGCGCMNKTEQKLYELLSQIYPMLERQYKVDWCKNISYLPFDFVLKLLKIIIELDGPQHFIQIMNWKSPEETRKGDIYKMECANENGYSVIRLTQEDVYYDRYDWLSELVASIKKIVEENVVKNIYLCKNNEYEHFNPI